MQGQREGADDTHQLVDVSSRTNNAERYSGDTGEGMEPQHQHQQLLEEQPKQSEQPEQDKEKTGTTCVTAVSTPQQQPKEQEEQGERSAKAESTANATEEAVRQAIEHKLEEQLRLLDEGNEKDTSAVHKHSTTDPSLFDSGLEYLAHEHGLIGSDLEFVRSLKHCGQRQFCKMVFEQSLPAGCVPAVMPAPPPTSFQPASPNKRKSPLFPPPSLSLLFLFLLLHLLALALICRCRCVLWPFLLGAYVWRSTAEEIAAAQLHMQCEYSALLDILADPSTTLEDTTISEHVSR